MLLLSASQSKLVMNPSIFFHIFHLDYLSVMNYCTSLTMNFPSAVLATFRSCVTSFSVARHMYSFSMCIISELSCCPNSGRLVSDNYLPGCLQAPLLWRPLCLSPAAELAFGKWFILPKPTLPGVQCPLRFPVRVSRTTSEAQPFSLQSVSYQVNVWNTTELRPRATASSLSFHLAYVSAVMKICPFVGRSEHHKMQ